MNALADKYRIAYEEEQLLCALKCKSLQEQLAAARAEVKRMRKALERIATCTVTRSFRDTAIAALRHAPGSKPAELTSDDSAVPEED